MKKTIETPLPDTDPIEENYEPMEKIGEVTNFDWDEEVKKGLATETKPMQIEDFEQKNKKINLQDYKEYTTPTGEKFHLKFHVKGITVDHENLEVSLVKQETESKTIQLEEAECPQWLLGEYIKKKGESVDKDLENIRSFNKNRKQEKEQKK